MRLVLSLFSLLFFLTAVASDKEPLDKREWQKLSKDLNYKREIPEPEQEEPEEYSDYDNSASSSSVPSFGNFKYLFMAIVVVLLIILIVFMIINSRANPNLKNQRIAIEKIEKIEEHIHEVNLEDLFDDYVKESDYAMAIRISFLKIIKAFSEQKLIKWAKQKTNWEYQSELQNANTKMEFGKMIIHFEKVWYGEQQLSEDEFTEINDQFEYFKSKYISVEEAA